MSWIGNIIKAVFSNEGLKGGRGRGGDCQQPEIIDKHSPLIKKKKLAEETPQVDLESMTKIQLEEYSRNVLGVELDRRHNKKTLISKIKEIT
ncbi:MAG TPA: hypothetical protein EYG21_02055 [Nitrospinaceae bacterium]|jgi:hypothetical protein|nr:hypothetical protein [Nitrospinaceae bacterium]